MKTEIIEEDKELTDNEALVAWVFALSLIIGTTLLIWSLS